MVCRQRLTDNVFQSLRLDIHPRIEDELRPVRLCLRLSEIPGNRLAELGQAGLKKSARRLQADLDVGDSRHLLGKIGRQMAQQGGHPLRHDKRVFSHQRSLRI